MEPREGGPTSDWPTMNNDDGPSGGAMPGGGTPGEGIADAGSIPGGIGGGSSADAGVGPSLDAGTSDEMDADQQPACDAGGDAESRDGAACVAPSDAEICAPQHDAETPGADGGETQGDGGVGAFTAPADPGDAGGDGASELSDAQSC